ncbi:MAG: DUF421 domain-containing protein [Turicibacter sp.]|nr:DUF421 domain-containing protein [Turicibacter sp.]
MSFNYYLTIYRTFILYVLLLVVFKLMGKKEVGELTVIDLVVSILMAEIAAMAIDFNRSMQEIFLAITLLGSLQLLTAFITLRSKKLRDVIDGKPAILIHNGVVNIEEMKKQRYNFDDLMVQLRMKDITSVFEVEYAILEANGQLTAFKKDSCPYNPLPIIVSGVLVQENLTKIDRDTDWLNAQMEAEGILFVGDVYYAAYDGNRLRFITRATLNMHEERTYRK